jgi:NhaP-type Na+/H+ or K+/H+ antiporter
VENSIVVVGFLIVLVAASAFSQRLGVAAPIVLVVIGIGCSFFIPGVAHYELSPELVLDVLLPLLLYAAAVHVPVTDFRRNLGSIGMLSVVLVVVSAVLVGLLLWALLPQLNLAAAIALGAVVSPTDAVAATAVAKRLGLPSRVVTLLEGESLVNDATALVLLKSALAAVVATVSVWGVVGQFAYSVVVSIAIGFAVGIVTVWIRAKFSEPVFDTVISFVVPFLAFLPAEALGTSGALAVVVAGVYSGHQGVRKFSVRARMSEQIVWRAIAFVIENGVFLLMGTQLLSLVEKSLAHPDIGLLATICLGLLVVVVLLVIRGVVMVPVLLSIRSAAAKADDSRERLSSMRDHLGQVMERVGDSERLHRRAARLTRGIDRRDADIADLQRNNVSWREGVVLTWAGMRGVVTLAAVQSLPADTPYRAQLILIACVVALVSIVVQGSTLPLVIRSTGLRGTDAVAETRELASLLDEMAEAGERVLDDPDLEQTLGQPVAAEVVEQLRSGIGVLGDAFREGADVREGTRESGPYVLYRQLFALVLQAERDALLEARSTAAYSSQVLSRAQRVLDRQQGQFGPIEPPG